MATATALRLRVSPPGDRSLAGLAVAGAAGCVILTITLAAGHVVGPGSAAVAAAGFLLLVAWCFLHLRVDQTLAALALYLGLLDGYIKLRTGSPTVTLARDVLVAAIAGGALARAMAAEQRLKLPPLGGLVIAFSTVVLIELFNPNGRDVVGGLAGVRQHLEFVPLFFLGYAFIRRESQIQKFLFILVVCAAVGGVISYIQSTLTPQELAGWGDGYRERILGTGLFSDAPRTTSDEAGNSAVRPFGLGADAGAGAVAAALALPALIAMIMSTTGKLRLAAIPMSAGIVLALATSGSRGALVMAVVCALAFGLFAAASRNALRVMVGLSVGMVLVYGAFQQLGSTNSATERTQSIVTSDAVSTYSSERGDSLAKFDEYALEYPLGIGVGWGGPAAGVSGQLDEEHRKFDFETAWNFFVLETGLVGLAIFLVLNFRLISLAITRIRQFGDQRMRLYLAALAAPIVGLFVQNFSGATTVSVPSAPYFWLVSGVLSYWLVTLRHRPPFDVERVRT